MLSRLAPIVLALLLLGACASAPAAHIAAPSDVVLISDVHLIAMDGGPPVLARRDVLVGRGRIEAIAPHGRLRVPRGARTIDGRGRYLLPGLADMHVHLEYIDDPNVLRLFVVNGVTSVRSMDGRPFILDWRDRVREGSLLGPRIVTAGPIVDGAPPARPDNLAVADAAAAAAAVREQAGRGYDFIKLYTNLSPEAHAAAADEARRAGLRVAGHIPRSTPLAAALAAHWSIEHLGDFAPLVAAEGAAVPSWARRAIAAPLDPLRTATLARQIAEARVWIVPTLVQQDRWLAPTAEVERWLQEPAISQLPQDILDQWLASISRFSGRLDGGDWTMLEQAKRNRRSLVAALHRAGVRIVVGTDTPNPFVAMGASVHIELANLVESGLSPLEALAAATIQPARMLGLEREQGSISVGMRADLLLVSGNPLEDIGRTRDIAGVMLNGQWFGAEELRALPRALHSSGAFP
jgi:imidazolonepropionase-like amidohydrolase